MCLGTTGADLTVNLWEEGWIWRGYRAVLGEEDVTHWQCRLVSGDKLSRCLYFTEGSVRTHTHWSTAKVNTTSLDTTVCGCVCSAFMFVQSERRGCRAWRAPPAWTSRAPSQGKPLWFGGCSCSQFNAAKFTEGQFVWRVVQRLWPLGQCVPTCCAHLVALGGLLLATAHCQSTSISADSGVGSVPGLDTRERRSGQGPGFSKPHFLVCGQDSSDFPSGKLGGASVNQSGRSSCSSQGQGDRLSALSCRVPLSKI